MYIFLVVVKFILYGGAYMIVAMYRVGLYGYLLSQEKQIGLIILLWGGARVNKKLRSGDLQFFIYRVQYSGGKVCEIKPILISATLCGY